MGKGTRGAGQEMQSCWQDSVVSETKQSPQSNDSLVFSYRIVLADASKARKNKATVKMTSWTLRPKPLNLNP